MPSSVNFLSTKNMHSTLHTLIDREGGSCRSQHDETSSVNSVGEWRQSTQGPMQASSFGGMTPSTPGGPRLSFHATSHASHHQAASTAHTDPMSLHTPHLTPSTHYHAALYGSAHIGHTSLQHHHAPIQLPPPPTPPEPTPSFLTKLPDDYVDDEEWVDLLQCLEDGDQAPDTESDGSQGECPPAGNSDRAAGSRRIQRATSSRQNSLMLIGIEDALTQDTSEPTSLSDLAALADNVQPTGEGRQRRQRQGPNAAHAPRRTFRKQMTQAARLQSRGIKAAAAIARNNNVLLARLDSKLGVHGCEMEGLRSAVQGIHQMADWVQQVHSLNRELVVYKNEAAHKHDAWIKVTEMLQEKEAELQMARGEWDLERHAAEEHARNDKALLDTTQRELADMAEELRLAQAQLKDLKESGHVQHSHFVHQELAHGARTPKAGRTSSDGGSRGLTEGEGSEHIHELLAPEATRSKEADRVVRKAALMVKKHADKFQAQLKEKDARIRDLEGQLAAASAAEQGRSKGVDDGDREHPGEVVAQSSGAAHGGRVSDLEQQLREMQGKLQQANRLQQQLQEAEAKLQGDSAQTLAAEKQVSGVKQQLHELEGKLLQAAAQAQAAEQQASAYQQQLQETEAQLKQATTLAQASEQEAASLKQLLQEVETKHGQAAAQAQAAEQQMSDLQLRLADAETRQKQAAAQAQAAALLTSDLKQQLHEADAKLQAAAAQVQAAEQKASGLQQQLTSAETKLEASQQQIQQLQAQASEQAAQLLALSQDLHTARTSLQQAEVKAARDLAAGAAASVNAEHVSKALEELASVSKELEREREMNEGVLLEVQQLSARLRDAEAKCASLNRELAAANEQRVAAAKEAAEASASAVETTQELDAAQARIEVLENQLEALRAQLSETELKATALHRQAHRHGLSRSSSTGGGLEVAPVAAPGDKEGEGKEARLLLQARVNALEGELAAAQQRLSHFTAVARTAVESGLARHQGQDGGSLYQGSSSPRFSSPGSSKRASAEHTAALLALLGALRDTDVSYTSLTQEERGTSLSRIRLLQGQMEALLTTALDKDAPLGSLRSVVITAAEASGLPLHPREASRTLSLPAGLTHANSRSSSGGGAVPAGGARVSGAGSHSQWQAAGEAEAGWDVDINMEEVLAQQHVVSHHHHHNSVPEHLSHQSPLDYGDLHHDGVPGLKHGDGHSLGHAFGYGGGEFDDLMVRDEWTLPPAEPPPDFS